jgi:hypothetical protein
MIVQRAALSPSAAATPDPPGHSLWQSVSHPRKPERSTPISSIQPRPSQLAEEEPRHDFYAVLTSFRAYSPQELSILLIPWMAPAPHMGADDLQPIRLRPVEAPE